MSAPSAAASSAVGPAIRVRNARVGYGARTVLADLSLTVEPGELVGLVGPSGAGKTTVLRLLTGQADRLSGEVEVLGRRPQRGGAVRGIGYVPQLETVDWDFPLTVEQVVLLGRSAHSAWRPWFSRRERRAALDVLARLGIEGLAGRSIRALSGGQQQRMFLARALLHDSQVLLLDEPTSGVDVATRRDVLGVLEQLRRDGLTVLLTTHDLNHVAALLPRIVCLNGGVTGDGTPAEVLTEEVLARTYGAPMRVIDDGDRVVVVDPPPATVVPLSAGRDRRGGVQTARDELRAGAR